MKLFVVCAIFKFNLNTSSEFFSGGQVYCWGWNEHGMCGTGNEDNVLKPQLIDALKNEKCTQIACGAVHSFAVVCS